MSATNQKSALTLFNQTNVQEKFEKLLGKKAQGFISSVLQIVNGNKLLQNADPMTVYNAAATAAGLDLQLIRIWVLPG